MSDPALTGGCGCGAVRFELSEPLEAAAYCHCTRCQHRTGTAYQASGRAAPGSFRVVEGADRLRSWEPGGLPKTFCGDCGSHVFAGDPTGETLVVRLGAIDGDPGVRPQAHQFVSYAAAWSSLPDDGLPRFPERLGETDPL